MQSLLSVVVLEALEGKDRCSDSCSRPSSCQRYVKRDDFKEGKDFYLNPNRLLGNGERMVHSGGQNQINQEATPYRCSYTGALRIQDIIFACLHFLSSKSRKCAVEHCRWRVFKYVVDRAAMHSMNSQHQRRLSSYCCWMFQQHSRVPFSERFGMELLGLPISIIDTTSRDDFWRVWGFWWVQLNRKHALTRE